MVLCRCNRHASAARTFPVKIGPGCFYPILHDGARCAPSLKYAASRPVRPVNLSLNLVKSGEVMGGRGSGGHNSKGRLRDVQCARLDVHELDREGKLRLGTRGVLFGTIGFEVTGGPDAQQLVLEFPFRSASGDLLAPVRQVICCFWRKAHFGGKHLIFRCGECQRPARVLYARCTDRIWFFSCRKCAGITYQSTMGHSWDRSARRIEKLRARIQWGTGGTAPLKPRGMHERTYQHILGQLAYNEAVRKRGAGYACYDRPDQHSARLWRQCRNRFSAIGGWPDR
jgi:hypothetical protein